MSVVFENQVIAQYRDYSLNGDLALEREIRCSGHQLEWARIEFCKVFRDEINECLDLDIDRLEMMAFISGSHSVGASVVRIPAEARIDFLRARC